MKKVILPVTVVLAVSAIYFIKISPDPQLKEIFAGSVPIKVEIVDTEEKRTRGLSGGESLPANQGILLVFDEPGVHGIWMKDMNFPIDIIWISKTGKITDISPNVSPDSFPAVFKPLSPARYILEVNTGFAEANNLKIGDFVNFDN